MIKVFNKEHGRRINGAGDGGLGGKNPPEAETCVSGEAEDGRCGHCVPDTGFWNPTPGRPRELAGLPLPSQKGGVVKNSRRSHDEGFQAHPWIGKCWVKRANNYIIWE